MLVCGEVKRSIVAAEQSHMDCHITVVMSEKLTLFGGDTDACRRGLLVRRLHPDICQ